ncbi:MAG: hypothetical protein E6R03_12765 [Hyphomicrobiaceae bacterium]|nr:MAG: hypothetical protein E6R03_12765 [Hyphomicrobiaceae bacterium]
MSEIHISTVNFLEELKKLFGKRKVDSPLSTEEKIEAAVIAFREAYGRMVTHGLVLMELGDADGNYKLVSARPNLITQVGDQYYGERAAGISSPPGQVTGMRLGTGGATAASKTGAGAAIVTYLTASQKAIDGSYPTSALNGSSRRITFRTSYAAGEATGNGINECVLTNESPLTNVAGAAANTIARADNTLVTPTVNKGASDTLTVTWHHDLLGA